MAKRSGIVELLMATRQWINSLKSQNFLKAHPDHTNELIFEGFNDTYTTHGEDGEFNPWHFNYRVFKTSL